MKAHHTISSISLDHLETVTGGCGGGRRRRRWSSEEISISVQTGGAQPAAAGAQTASVAGTAAGGVNVIAV